MLNSKSVRPQPTVAAQPAVSVSQSRAITMQSRLQRAQTVRSAQQQAREHILMSRRSPQSVSPVSGMQSGQRQKERSLKSRLGSAPTSNVKQRLGSGSQRVGQVSPGGNARGAPAQRGATQPLSVRPIPRFRPARPIGSVQPTRQTGNTVRDRLGSAPTLNRPASGGSPRRHRGGAVVETDRRTLRGRGPVGQRGGRGRGPASNYGGFDSSRRANALRKRQHRRGGLTGRTSKTEKSEALSKDELDKQLDAYMSKSKAQLDAQLDTYMAHAGVASNAMQS